MFLYKHKKWLQIVSATIVLIFTLFIGWTMIYFDH